MQDPIAAPEGMTARTLIVVPTYNESGNVSELIAKIFASVPEVELLVVDDDSTRQ